MTDVTSVYVTLNDEDDECFEVCSEESYLSEPSCTKGNTALRPQQQQRINANSQTECIVPDLVEVSNSNSAEDELFMASAEDYSSAFLLEIPRIQPTVRYDVMIQHTYYFSSVLCWWSLPFGFSSSKCWYQNSDLTCFLDILTVSKHNEEDEEPKKKKGSTRMRIKNRGTYPLPQPIDARDNIVPQEMSGTREKNYKPKTSETIRSSEQEQFLPLTTGKERKPKVRSSLSSIASSTPSTTCHYLAGSVMERRLTVSSATTSNNFTPSRNNLKTKSVDAPYGVSTTAAAKRPSTRERRS
eukprot:scaffold5955_cov95-Cylindrotheca_fusiformis.AAC.2